MLGGTIGVGLSLVLLIFFLSSRVEEKNRTSASTDNYASDSSTLHRGSILFDQHCASCHGIQGDAIGPPLGGITTLLSETALTEFIRHPAKVIELGDRRANELLKRYQTRMPAFEYLTLTQITDILAFIHQQSLVLQAAPLRVVPSNPKQPTVPLVPPIRTSGLTIELEDYVQFARTKDQPATKGIATLRAHPSGDGTLLVSDQMGIIYRVSPGGSTVFLDVRERVDHFIVEPGIGTGLGSFALHPGFSANGLIYTTHAEEYLGKPAINEGAFPDSVGVGLQWVLSEWKLHDTRATVFEGAPREILRLNTPTTAHGIQDINFAPTRSERDADYGMLYLGIGDGGSNNLKRPELADNVHSLLGTILRIDPLGNNSSNHHYGIPSDNPLVAEADPSVRKEIWAYGFRNPHRMCWDTTSGIRMLVADIGEANIEEVNIVRKGRNYGWSALEGNYGIDTRTDAKVVFPIAKDDLTPYEAPFGQFDHSQGKAISGGFVYRGSLKHLKNKYIFGDIVTGRLFYMNIDPNLSDSVVYDIAIRHHGQITTLKEISNFNRVNLRIGYDQYAGDLYIMTKGDAMVRRVTHAYYQENGQPSPIDKIATQPSP